MPTRRACERPLKDWMQFTGLVRPDDFRALTRARTRSPGATPW
jgi:hypothetical protein